MQRLFLSIVLAGVLAVIAGGPAAAQQPNQQGAQAAPAAQQQPSADDVFATLDKDKDGKLSADEFAGLMDHNATADQKKQTFAKWDADKDGYISKAEFTANYPRGGQQQR